jgi:hypothetical protein
LVRAPFWISCFRIGACWPVDRWQQRELGALRALPPPQAALPVTANPPGSHGDERDGIRTGRTQPRAGIDG